MPKSNRIGTSFTPLSLLPRPNINRKGRGSSVPYALRRREGGGKLARIAGSPRCETRKGSCGDFRAGDHGETRQPEVRWCYTRLEIRFGQPHPCVTGAPPFHSIGKRQLHF